MPTFNQKDKTKKGDFWALFIDGLHVCIYVPEIKDTVNIYICK